MNAADGDGMTAPHHACMLSSSESTAFEGIVPGTMDYDWYGGGARGDILLDLCSAPGINLDLVDHGGETALCKAVHAGNIPHVRALIRNGVSTHVEGAKQIICTSEKKCSEMVGFQDLSDLFDHMSSHFVFMY